MDEEEIEVEPSVLDQGYRVITTGQSFSEGLILDVMDEDQQTIFEKDFELVGSDFLENTDFYQGLRKTAVIKRKADGVLFGYAYFDDISKYGEAYIEANGDSHGFDDYETFVWLPVKEVQILGYEVVEPKK